MTIINTCIHNDIALNMSMGVMGLDDDGVGYTLIYVTRGIPYRLYKVWVISSY